MKKSIASHLCFLFWIFLPCFASVADAQAATIGANGRVERGSPPTMVQEQMQQIFQKLQAATTPEEQEPLFRQVLQLDPDNPVVHFQLGMLKFGAASPFVRDQGMSHLEKSLDNSRGDSPAALPSAGGMRMAMMLGRYRWEIKDFLKAFYYLTLASRAAPIVPGPDGNQDTSKLCVDASLATMLHPYPNTTRQADQMYELYMKTAREFLQERKRTGSKTRWNERELEVVPGAAEDPYVHCILTLFHLSFYYRANVAEAARLHYQVATSVWPELKYTAPSVVPKLPTVPPHQNIHNKPCVTRKIKLGIASGFLSPGSSVSADFGGVMQRLDRDIFNITYLHFKNASGTPTDPFVYRHQKTHGDTVLTFARDPNEQFNSGAWPTTLYSDVESLDLDVLLYLDLTMSPFANRMAMARLAPVQANSHGHPVTSGIENVDYFISWGAAELDHETANTHYSEELILLDSNVPHQYYSPRMERGVSMMNGEYYADKTNRLFFRTFMVPAEVQIKKKGNFPPGMFDDKANHVRWYTCMQKPHKFMPELDPLLCDVLEEDENGVLIMHQPDTQKLVEGFERRLRAANCDMNRVYFLPALPHHMLLALYQVSTLILDSYPAGGCTTTREALELNKVVVTLPARLLGGRWSYAYYQILNDPILNKHVIASSHQDYVEKVGILGGDVNLRTEMEQRIAESLPNLYRQWDAVHSWERALLKISPVEKRDQCDA
ncbi:Inherit from COG: protein N-acetylglucosaminyltransferase activity [Seminavis robusta]|uniref:Inherit from COG: protein N-acetylglucosaminyltransferase activity n=1 Tax=Seminavis robusta TaxID=568900 RepID=A0A9N8HRY4_9STRA|nr:Inherit from COG: protein N-acetylglucosaminyltransferase activity [Seminavis robusta]|eukprot:Sro1370_g267010.1 Inherit from COG: protein N-acetylglucosaminyltransferase activity (720) ;mRNA; r:12767-14926